MNDKKYWEEYYSKNSKPTIPSPFAKFIISKLKPNKTLIELGCGNGRDSVFISKNKINVIAIDQIEDEINFLNKNYSNKNLKFICDDFTNLSNSKNDLIKNTHFDYIYSRFTFHSINEEKENNTLDWIEKTLNNGLFFIEARSIKDPLLKKGKKISENENFTTHYRRYMDLQKFKEKLESKNFEIIFEKEDINLSPYNNENPYIIRIIAKK